MTESAIACCHTPSDLQVPRSILRAMDGAKAFLHSSLLKVPWMWRVDSASPTVNGEIVTDELRNYQKTVRSQINLLRQIPSNRICIDCGNGWLPWNVTEKEEGEEARRICWANVSLGVFLCSNCAKLHQQLLPKSISKILCLEWDTHYWTKDDLIKCANWGNYTAQRYWASGYFSRIVNRGKFWKASSDGFWCPRMPGDEYIVKKYIEKRWVATTKIPDIPSGKKYRKQETEVLNFVSSWELNGNLKTKRYSSETPASFHVLPVRLLKKGEIVERINDRNILATDATHYSRTFATLKGVEDKVKENTDPKLSTTAVGTLNVHHKMENLLEIATPGLDDFDFRIPQSFEFNILSPNIKHANHGTSETSGSQSPSATNIPPSNTNVDGLDVIIFVCDVGVQTSEDFGT